MQKGRYRSKRWFCRVPKTHFTHAEKRLEDDDYPMEFLPDKHERPLLPGDFMILKELTKQNPNRYSGNVIPTEIIKSVASEGGGWAVLLRQV